MDGSSAKKFQKLEEWGEYLFDPKDIYLRYYGFTIKTFDHKIYSIGNNVCGDAGVGSTDSKISTFTEIDMKNIESNDNCNNYVSCISNTGGNHILYCINDIVYANGSSSSINNLISKSNESSILSPSRLDTSIIKDKIIQIECGTSHNLFLTINGGMYAVGIDNDQYEITKLSKVPCDAFIKLIKCAWSHNLCLSDKGELYMFGGISLVKINGTQVTLHKF